MTGLKLRGEHTFGYDPDAYREAEEQARKAQEAYLKTMNDGVAKPWTMTNDALLGNVPKNYDDGRSYHQFVIDNSIGSLDINGMTDAEADGLFRNCIANVLGWGEFAANGADVFGRKGDETDRLAHAKENLKRLQDWGKGNGDLMSAEQEAFNQMVPEDQVEYGKKLLGSFFFDAEMTPIAGNAYDAKMAELTMDENIKSGGAIDKFDYAERMRAAYNAKTPEEYYRALGRKDADYTEADKVAREAMVKAKNDEIIKRTKAELAKRNMIQTLEANAVNLSDQARAFVASTASTGDFNAEVFKKLDPREQVQAMALVKIRRGEQNEVKALGFIPLADLRNEKGEMRNLVRTVYGVGWSVTDMFTDVGSTLGDWAEKGWIEGKAAVMGNIIGDREAAKQYKKEAYSDMEFDRKVKLAMTQDRPDAEGWGWKTATGFGDNFGFLLVSEVGGFAKLAVMSGTKAFNTASKIVRAEKAVEEAQKALEVAKAAGKAEEIASAQKKLEYITGNLSKLTQAEPSRIMRPFEKAGTMMGEAQVKAGELAANVGKQTQEVQRAAELFMRQQKYAAKLPEAKKAYNAAKVALEDARAGRGTLSVEEAMSNLRTAGAEYGRAARAANPTMQVEAAVANGQFYQDLKAAHAEIAKYNKWLEKTGRGIELSGKVAENALWFLPFYTRRLDRAVANGEPFEQATNSAFVTMLWSGITEKAAFTKAAKLGIGNVKMTRQSYETILSLVGNAVIRKTTADAAKRNLAQAGKIFLERQATNLAHGIDTAFNVTAQSVADEWGVMISEIWNENKKAFDDNKISKEDFMMAFMPSEKWVNTCMETVKQGGWAAAGFAAFSGTNARFGAWRHSRANRNLTGESVYTPFGNYKLKNNEGLIEAYDHLSQATGNAFAFHVDELSNLAGDAEAQASLPDSTPEEKAAAKESRKNVAEDARAKMTETLGKVFRLAEETGGINTVDQIMEATGVDQNTAELLMSAANDYAALSVREDARVMYNDFLERMNVNDAEFAMRQFARYAPNVRNVQQDELGNMTLDVDVGNGQWRTIGITRDEEVTRQAIAEAVSDDSDVGRHFNERQAPNEANAIVDENGVPYRSWDEVPEDKRAQYAAMVIEGNNNRGSAIWILGKDGRKNKVQIADIIALVDNKTGVRTVSHEVSHSLWRAAEEMGLVTLDMKAAIADAIGIDRTSDAAQAWHDDTHAYRNWEVEVDEAIARGYAEYTQGRSAPSLPQMKTAFDSINNAGNWLINNLFGGAEAERKNETVLDDFYETMFRGDLEALKDVVPAMTGNAPRVEDANLVRRQARAKYDAAREEFEKLRGLVERGKLGKNSPRFTEAKQAMIDAQLELNEARYNEVNRYSLKGVDVDRITVEDLFRGLVSTDASNYSWEALSKLPNMKVVDLTAEKRLQPNATREQMIAAGKASVDADGTVTIPDFGKVNVGKRGLDHGLRLYQDKNLKYADIENENNAKVLPVIGDVLRNSIPVNELAPDGTDTKSVFNSTVFLGAFRDGDEIIPVVTVVNASRSDSNLNAETRTADVDAVYALKSINAKTAEGIASAVKASVGSRPADEADSAFKAVPDLDAISVSDLIDSVKDVLPVMSKDVYSHFGVERPQSSYKNLRYSLISTEHDAAYIDAVKRGDVETAQRMLRDAAERAGYSADVGYRISHHAPTNDGYNASLVDVEPMFGTSDRAELLRMGYGRSTAYDAVSAIMKANGNPDAMIEVYRAVPKSVKDVNLRRGDWVALSESYARQHGEAWLDGKYKIIKAEVPAKHLFTDGNMLEEAGFDDGQERAYKNTKNGTKLLGVTYDDNGDVIPLSKRFNDRNSDIRYSLILGEKGARQFEENGKVVDNLGVAREMLGDRDWKSLSEGDKVKIKFATGWEMGADGKWRYEIPDLKYLFGSADNYVGFQDKIASLKTDARDDLEKLNKYWRKATADAEEKYGVDVQWDFDKIHEFLPRMYNIIKARLADTLEALKKLERQFKKAKFPKTKFTIRDFASGTMLEKAYPEIMDTKITIKSMRGNYAGMVKNGEIIIDSSESPVEAFKTVTHEIQHMIQKTEGFARGGNERYDGKEGYRRLAGEVEARNAEKRIGFMRKGGVQYWVDRIAESGADPSTVHTWLLEQTEDVDRDSQVVLTDFATSARQVISAMQSQPSSRYSLTPADVGGSQKRADVAYPDASAEIASTRFSLADDAKRLILKKRPDLWQDVETDKIESYLGTDSFSSVDGWTDIVNEKRAGEVVAEIMKFGDTKTQKAALNWFVRGAIMLPEDAPKVKEALGYAARAKGKANTDPFAYKSPMAMIEALHEFKPKAKPINPDTVPELTDKKVLPNGVTTYLVQDDRAGQEAMRRIINTHWGEDANPWCLLHGDGNGNLSDGRNGEYDAAYYWRRYSAIPKRVAFKDGKLLAFMATDEGGVDDYDFENNLIDVVEFEYPEIHDEYYDGTDKPRFHEWMMEAYPDEYQEVIKNNFTPNEKWWDRQDEDHEGIPLGNVPVDGDPFGRWAAFEIRDGAVKQVGGYHKGEQGQDGFTSWYMNGFKAVYVKKVGDEFYDWNIDGTLERYKGPRLTLFNYEKQADGSVLVTDYHGTVPLNENKEAERIYRENDQRVPHGAGVDSVESDGTVRFSLKTYDTDGRETLARWLEQSVGNGSLTRQDADDILGSTDAVRDVMKKWAKAKKYASFGKWSEAKVELDENGKPYFGVIRTNGDYAYNIDFSTVCKKRRPLDAIFNELVNRGIVNAENIGTLLSRTNIPKMQEIIKRHGLEVACALCFVDAKRYNLGKDTEAFSNLWNNLVEEKLNQPKKWAKRLADAEGESTYLARCVRKIEEDASARVKVDPSELLSGEKFDEFVKTKSEVASMYRSFKGQAKAKESTLDVPYNNDILRMFKHSLNPDVPTTISQEQAFEVGGVRLQSFSDFVSRLTFDYVQMFADLAARKLPLHSYTKEPDFIKLFGRTGAKLNMSLVPNGTGVKWVSEADRKAQKLIAIHGADNKPVVKDGKVACFDFADECFPPEEAFALRSKDGNVGTIMVGVSDEHIELMLTDPRIDMVIPYYKSSINPEVAKARGIDKFADYTAVQHTKGAKKGKDFDFYADLGYLDKKGTNDPRQTAKNYVKWCKSNKFTPKFSKWTEHENYYKLLADFRLYTDDGTYAPQTAVKAVVPDAAWQKAAMEALSHDNEGAVKMDQETESIVEEISREVFGIDKKSGRFSLAVPPELSSAFTTEDLLAMAAAGRMAKNPTGAESVRADMAKRLKELQPSSTDADVTRIMNRAQGEAQAVLKGMENSASADIMNRLTARQIERYFSSLRSAGKKGIGEGVKAERARQELDERQAQKVADSIAAQTGLAVNELETTLGVDLAETIVRLNEIMDEAEKAKGEEVEPVAGDGDADAHEAEPFPAEPTPEQKAAQEQAIRELCEAIRDKAWQKTEEWKAKQEERKRKLAEKETELTEDDLPPADAEEEEIPTTADDLAQFIATKRAIDLRNPEHFAQFIATMCEQKWIADHGLQLDAYVWKDPVALQHLRMTAANVYSTLARKLMYSGRRETAFNTINKIEKATTFGAVLREMEFCGKVIAQGMVTEKASDLVKEIDKLLEQGFGAKGRFKQNEEDIHRKVTGETEKWARAVRKVLYWGEQKCTNEMQKCMERLAGVEAEFMVNDRDPQSSKQFAKDMLLIGAIREYGNMMHKSLGEITDAKWKIVERLQNDHVAEEAVARDERTQAMADTLDKAFDTGHLAQYDDPRDSAAVKAGKAINRYFQMHLDFKNLLLDLMRRSKNPTDVAAAQEFVNNLQHDIQRRWDAAQTEMREQRDWFHAMIEQVYGKGKFGKVMSELMRHDERFDKFGQGEINEQTGKATMVKMSKAQAMNLYVAMQQKGYLDNVVKNNREAQSIELRQLFTKEDLLLIKRLGDWYDKGRKGLSEVSMRLFGIPVEAEEANYFPVTPLRPSQGLEKGMTSGWSPFPPALTARVRHGLDFDVRTDIFTVWMDHMAKQAQWKNMADLGVELRGIFGRQSVQSTIRRCHGQAVLTNVLSFITDILNGQVQSAEPKWVSESIDRARGWAALAALGGNIGVTIKQMTSIPAFAFEVGFRETGKHLLTAFTPEGIAAMREIWNSSQRKNRWDAGNSEEVTNALNLNKPSALKKWMQRSMIFNKVGDSVPALVVGQGVYRSFVRQGLTREEALNRTWEIINRTQQTGQMDNLSVFQRRSAVGRLITQFQSTLRQFLSYEIAATRQLAAQPKSGKAWADFSRATVLNMMLGGLYAMGGSLWQWILGRDPDEEFLNSWIESALTGPYSSLFAIGGFATTMSQLAVEGKVPFGASKQIPALDFINTVATDLLKAGYSGAALLGDAIGWGETELTLDDLLKPLDHLGKRVNSLYRDARKVYDNRIADPDQKTPQRKPTTRSTGATRREPRRRD